MNLKIRFQRIVHRLTGRTTLLATLALLGASAIASNAEAARHPTWYNQYRVEYSRGPSYGWRTSGTHSTYGGALRDSNRQRWQGNATRVWSDRTWKYHTPPGSYFEPRRRHGGY